MHTGTVDVDYPQLLSFRTALRRFLRWSDDAAEAEGVAPAQYQLLVVVKGLSDVAAPSIGQVAEQLLLRHHSASELVHRAEESGLVRTKPDPADHRSIRLALTARGERVLYWPRAIVHHNIPRQRLTKAYFRKWHWDAGSMAAQDRGKR